MRYPYLHGKIGFMMASENKLLNLVQTVLEKLKVLRSKFKLQNVASTTAKNEIMEFKVSHKSFEKIILEIFVYVDYIQKKVGSQASASVTPGFHEVIECLKLKMNSYAKVSKSAHISFCEEQEIEKSDQCARKKNLRISDLPESDKE